MPALNEPPEMANLNNMANSHPETPWLTGSAQDTNRWETPAYNQLQTGVIAARVLPPGET
jgi:hypothetical protein